MKTNLKNSFSKTLLALSISTATAVSHAGSFGLIEQGASGQGSAYAGAAAIAEDASTIYFNPAGMTKLSGQQIVVAGHIISASADYTDKGSTNAVGGDLGGTASKTDEVGFIPNFYYSADIGNDVYAGVGVNVPFGLATEYEDGWKGRYHALRSEITSININPSIAWKATDKVSVGFGINIQYLDLELTNALNTGAICFGLTGGPTCSPPSPVPASGDSSVKLEGDSTEIGWNAGILFDVNEATRVGVAYRSSIRHNVSGKTTYNLDPALQGVADGATAASGFNILQSGGLKAQAELPALFAVSLVHDIDAKWSILADWTWAGWSSLDTVTIIEEGGAPGNEPTLPLEYRDTSRYSLGVNYRRNDQWIYRAGLAYDQTPIRTPEQTSARIPGNDRTWLSVGLGYAPSASWSMDFGYSHLFLKDVEINNTNSTGDTLTGEYDSTVDIFSAGVNFYF
jgi:long-chain fatty acid transport protein